MRVVLVILAVLLISSPTLGQASKSADRYGLTDEVYQAILALNYCHYSLVKIKDSNDRVILDEEYNNIISNINLSTIKDKRIIHVLKELMDVLTEYKLDDRTKLKVLKIYEKRVERSILEAASKAGEGATSPQMLEKIAKGGAAMAATGMALSAGTGPAAPVAAAGVVVTTVVVSGKMYMDYKQAITEYKNELDETVWNLDSNAITRINEINKVFLETYWQMMKDYEIPDELRLTSGQLEDFITIIKDSDVARRYRNLNRIEKTYGILPPYWYYRAVAAHSLENIDDVKVCRVRYQEAPAGFFRNDILLSSIVMLEMSNEAAQNPQFASDLNIVISEDPKNPNKKIFAAGMYITRGDYGKAKGLLQENIDMKRAKNLSIKMLSDVYYLSGNRAALGELIDTTVNDDTLSNMEKMYLVGRLSSEDAIAKIKPQIMDIDITIQRSLLGKDGVTVNLPVDWIVSDPENFSPKLSFDGKDFKPSETEPHEGKSIQLVFDDVLDVAESLDENITHELTIFLKASGWIMEYSAELTPVEKEVNENYAEKVMSSTVEVSKKGAEGAAKLWGKYVKGNDSEKNEAQTDGDGTKGMKIIKVLELKNKRVSTLDTCFIITDEGQLVGCYARQ